jgi:hypothetical protein
MKRSRRTLCLPGWACVIRPRTNEGQETCFKPLVGGRGALCGSRKLLSRVAFSMAGTYGGGAGPPGARCNIGGRPGPPRPRIASFQVIHGPYSKRMTSRITASRSRITSLGFGFLLSSFIQTTSLSWPRPRISRPRPKAWTPNGLPLFPSLSLTQPSLVDCISSCICTGRLGRARDLAFR